VDALAAALTTATRTAVVQPDEEHQAFALAIEDRSGGYPRHHRIDQDFVTTGEFRTLAASYQDVKDIRGPMVVKTTGTTQADVAVPEETLENTAAANETAIGGAPLDEATRLAAEPKPLDSSAGPKQPHKAVRDADVRVETLDELVEFFTAAGKKGVAVNRYKGLGEMNPSTLWETTMDPERRTLLSVRLEDIAECETIFTTLMGEDVEARRKFIEENALDVKNLDI
jgi:DNA gyrase subunit B